MTVHTLKAGTPGLTLTAGYTLVLEAISPTTGDAITDVTVDRIAIFGINLADDANDTAPGPFILVPGTPTVGGAAAYPGIH